MRTSQAVQVSATGDVTTRDAHLRAVVLTPDGTNACSVVVKAGGSSGTTILTLRTSGTQSVVAADLGDIDCGGGIHATLTGTGAVADFVYA